MHNMTNEGEYSIIEIFLLVIRQINLFEHSVLSLS